MVDDKPHGTPNEGELAVGRQEGYRSRPDTKLTPALGA
jgi:hypothetical protein